MTHPLELPESVYRRLVEAAKATGTTPADWIAERLPTKPGPVTEAERLVANSRLDHCRISSGHPSGIDNDQIDADLAREYGDDHAGIDPRSN